MNRQLSFSAQSGFSLVEMLIASALVVLLSATSYQILTGQGKGQKDSVYAQKKNTMMLNALDHIKTDAMKIDSNWSRYDIASVYPAQGFAFGDNFYVDSYVQQYGLSDGVTFLRRSVENSELYSLANDAGFPAAAGGGTAIYDDWLTLNEAAASVKVGNWVLLFEPQKYALGVVTDIQDTVPAKIKIRQPNNAETVQTFPNIWGRSSGYVTRLGVVPMSCDWTGSNTATTDDDTLILEKVATKVQVLDSPVSYFLDFATNNGEPHSHGNSFVLDSEGNRKMMLVRAEYVGTKVKHEYVGEANQLGITYDVLKSTYDGVDSLNGYTDGEVEKDIGRDSTTAIQFVNLAVTPDSSEGFISTSRILALRVFLNNDLNASAQVERNKYNEIHIALDPSLDNRRYQDEGKSLANDSENLGDSNDLDKQQIGQPLYFRQPGSDKVAVIAPVSYMNKAEEGFQNGKLLITDEKGCPITTGVCGAPDPKSEITFQSSSDNSYFYPNTMIQVNDDPTKTKILVGGFSVTVDDSVYPAVVTRKPAMASIDIPTDQTLVDVLKNNNSSGTLCSLSSCKLETLDTSNLGNSVGRLQDTAGGFATDKDNNLYVASITHQNGADGSLSVYKTTLATNNHIVNPVQEVVVDSTSTYSQNRVVSAIAQTPVTIDGTDYLPMCLSRSLQSGSTPQEDGKILLYNLNGTGPAPIHVGDQNYKCTSLSVVEGNLLIGGKLVFQVMHYEDMSAIVKGQSTQPVKFYLDEIAAQIDSSTRYYADAYKTLPSVYENPAPSDYQQVLGYNLGLSVQPISPTQFGIVMGNRALIEEDGGVKGTVTTDQQDFTTMSVVFGGMQENLLATITTDTENLNMSKVDVQYTDSKLNFPSVILPGVFYYNPTTPRQIMAALPNISSGMSDNNWLDFYIDYMDMHDLASGAEIASVNNSNDDGGSSCSNSYPPTCGGEGDHGGTQQGNGGTLDDGGSQSGGSEDAQPIDGQTNE